MMFIFLVVLSLISDVSTAYAQDCCIAPSDCPPIAGFQAACIMHDPNCNPQRLCSYTPIGPGTSPYGPVSAPPGVTIFGSSTTGLPLFLNVVLRTLVIIAGIYSLLNFVFAGYSYLSGAGDPKKIHEAQTKIWHTVIGIIVAAGSFLIAALVGWLLFRDPKALLNIRLFGP